MTVAEAIYLYGGIPGCLSLVFSIEGKRFKAQDVPREKFSLLVDHVSIDTTNLARVVHVRREE